MESDIIDLGTSSFANSAIPAYDIAVYDVDYNPFGDLKDLLVIVDEIGVITICDTGRSSKQREVWSEW